MNKTVKLLYEEHETIINAIDAAGMAKSLIGKDDQAYEHMIRTLLVFFRQYADKYHHYKEEEVLFPEMCKRNELIAEGIVREMLENHEDFRKKIAQIERSLNEKNFSRTQSLLIEYTEALLDHIAVENDEVFQVAESLFTEIELDKMYYQFIDIDVAIGGGKKDELKELVDTLRKNILMAE
jgi:hemerythrin-like domain-containing protein